MVITMRIADEQQQQHHQPDVASVMSDDSSPGPVVNVDVFEVLCRKISPLTRNLFNGFNCECNIALSRL